MPRLLVNMPKQHVYKKYHLSPDALLGKGMEAEVYAYGPDAVLKLYHGTTNLTHLTSLKSFYDSLDYSHIPYALPRIYTVTKEDTVLVTIEQRLPGTCLSSILPSFTPPQLEYIWPKYLAAVLALSKVTISSPIGRHKLFDSTGISQGGDWHQFLTRYLDEKLAQIKPYLARDVTNFAAKVEQLQAILAQPYPDSCYLIHGDFFPGNLLINDDQHITALLDFGLMTMYGDPLFDIATSWVFFDMYDKLKANIRDRYLSIILKTLGEGVRGKLYRYVIIYSILSANTYSSQCVDGHYHWCVANLNQQAYWQYIE